MLTKLNLTSILLLLSSSILFAQNNYDVKLGRDNVAITKVKLTFNGATLTQTSGHSVTTQTSLPVDLVEVTVNDGGTLKTLDQLNFFGSTIRNNNFTSAVGGVGVYNEGVTTLASNATAFESAMDNVAGGANLLSYLYYDGTSNLPSGDDFDMFWSYGLDSEDYIVVAERDGNTYFTVTPLDSMGNPITSARKLRFGQTNGTASPNGNRKYDWNIGYRPTNQNQPMYMTVVDVDLFNANTSIHGIRIDNNGQADVKFFGVSDDPFTNNRPTTVISGIRGNVYADGNGMINNKVDGTALSAAAGSQLFVSAINTAGTIIRTTEVDADGTYEILDISTGTYTLKVHTTSAGSNTSAAPTGWYHTGENLGSGIGHDGSIDGSLSGISVNDSLVSFANFGLFTSPLSVKWKKIGVQDMAEYGHKIEWITTSENGSEYFEIERSLDGINWEYIGYREATGYTTEETAYSYLDVLGADLVSQEISYRVKEVGVDGREMYSSVVYLSKTFDGKFSIYPNPMSENATVSIIGKKIDLSSTRLSDAAGTDMSFALSACMNGGVSIDAASLRSGVYIVSIYTNGVPSTKRILVQR